MVKIYTKTGDRGTTSLFGGQRVCKSCLDMRVVGELDELNAVLGIIGVLLKKEKFNELSGFIQNIQGDLFKIGSEVASRQTKLSNKIKKIDCSRVKEMEKMIDAWSRELPELKNFILPGGCLAAAHLHQARAVCRRAERELVAFGKPCARASSAQGKQKKVRPGLYIYLNRLSDFLFVLARWINFQLGIEEL